MERNSQGTRPKNGEVVEQRRPKLKEVDVWVVSDAWW